MKMNTPICDFVKEYAERNAARLHVPGHKGCGFLGVEKYDVTEIEGADVLYRGDGIIRMSENNASAIFGSAKTLYSAEGSSLSIRAMVYLATLYAKQNGRSGKILACRNAHRSFMTGCALLDVDVEWLYSDKDRGVMACEITPDMLDDTLAKCEKKPTAVYVTSPDYLGNVADIKGLSDVCHKYGVLLMVDNAHGAYLNFLKDNKHPMYLGADMCCDSAHKTMPVLTGGGYLHIGKNAPEILSDNAERAMMLFASTSPSYLILQSLDMANRYMTEGYRDRLNVFCEKVHNMKKRLCGKGFCLVGDEPLKLTVAPKSYGYTGEEFADALRNSNIECEYADRDYTVMMLTPNNVDEDLEILEDALLGIPKREAVCEDVPRLPRPRRAMTVREAMMSVSEEVLTRECCGRVLADAIVSCPPAIPIVVAGEVIDDEAIKCLEYYGITKCNVCIER